MSHDSDRAARIALEQHLRQQANERATCCANPGLDLLKVRQDGTREYECRCSVTATAGTGGQG